MINHKNRMTSSYQGSRVLLPHLNSSLILSLFAGMAGCCAYDAGVDTTEDDSVVDDVELDLQNGTATSGNFASGSAKDKV